MGSIHLTPEGYEEIRKELKYLKTVKRREISKDLAKARAHGDISENAEYDAAKEAQGLNEKRIAELEEKLGRANIIDESRLAKDKALIGATVKLKNVDTGDEITYTLVSELEADFKESKISIKSPVGKSLLGQKKGKTVTIKVPAGTLKYKILDITR